METINLSVTAARALELLSSQGMSKKSLHAKVREKQEESGQSLSQYITALITKYYEREGKTMANGNARTVAFQVDADLFERFKEYLKATGIKQNAFCIDCIQRAMKETQPNRA